MRWARQNWSDTSNSRRVKIHAPELSVGALPCQHAYTFKITDSELMPE
jgi:hypothetical protein